MPMKRCVVRVDPQGKAMVVDILDTSGVSVTAYESSEFAAARLTLPMTITGQTDFCLPSPGPYDVSCKVGGTEVANSGAAKRVQAGDTPVRVVPDWERELAGADSAASLPPEWLTGIVSYYTSTAYVLAESPNGKVFYPSLPLNPHALGPSAYVPGLAYNGIEWLMAVSAAKSGPGLGLLFRSTDGHTWVQVDNPFSTADVGDAIGGFCYFKGKWYAGSLNATGAETHAIMVSSDGGLTWATEDSPLDGGGIVTGGIACDSNHLVVVGGKSDGSAGAMFTTGDGTWTAITSPLDAGHINGVATNGTVWVATGVNADNTASVMSAAASDLTTWTEHSTALDAAGTLAVAWSGHRFWVGGDINSTGATTALHSTDGTTWTDGGNPLGTGSNGPLVITGNGALLLMSAQQTTPAGGAVTGWSDDDGATWHLIYPPDAYWSFAPRTSSIAIPPY